MTVLFSAFLAFIVRVLVLVSFKLVVNNFGKGLKEKGEQQITGCVMKYKQLFNTPLAGWGIAFL